MKERDRGGVDAFQSYERGRLAYSAFRPDRQLFLANSLLLRARGIHEGIGCSTRVPESTPHFDIRPPSASHLSISTLPTPTPSSRPISPTPGVA